MFLNFKEAFTFMFKDEKFWQKYIVGTFFTLLMLLPTWIVYPQIAAGTMAPIVSIGVSIIPMILGLFVMGFTSIYANSKITLKQDVLPEWGKDFGKIVKTGLKYVIGMFLFIVASLIALLPIFIVLAIIMAIIMGIMMAPAVASYGANVNPNDPSFNAMIAGYTLKAIFISSILLLPILLIWGSSLYLSMISFLTDLKLISFFNFKRMWSMLRGNVLNLVIIVAFIVIYSILNQILLKLVGYNACFALCMIVGFYFSMVYSNLYAQYALIGIQKHQQRLEEKEAKENASDAPQENIS